LVWLPGTVACRGGRVVHIGGADGDVCSFALADGVARPVPGRRVAYPDQASMAAEGRQAIRDASTMSKLHHVVGCTLSRSR
jgi:hypothetical protein